jgi:hypothetical protein
MLRRACITSIGKQELLYSSGFETSVKTWAVMIQRYQFQCLLWLVTSRRLVYVIKLRRAINVLVRRDTCLRAEAQICC